MRYGEVESNHQNISARRNASLKNRVVIITSAIALVGLCGLLATRMGTEFIPSLDEGDFALSINRIPGTSLTQSVEMQRRLEQALLKIPEVKEVFTRLGTAEVATDAQPPSVGDGYVMLKPRNEWPDPSKTKDEVADEIIDMLESYIGNKIELSQPIQMRMNELISGVKGDVAVKLFGDDLDQLQRAGQKVAGVLTRVQGVDEVNLERIAGLPFLTIKPRREAISRYGLSVNDVQEIIEVATKRLTLVVPVALVLIFVLLFLSFGTVTDALLIYTAIPLALTGGILALWFRGIPLSISAGVGFTALSGVAVLNGTVMISFIRKLRAEGNVSVNHISLESSFNLNRPRPKVPVTRVRIGIMF